MRTGRGVLRVSQFFSTHSLSVLVNLCRPCWTSYPTPASSIGLRSMRTRTGWNSTGPMQKVATHSQLGMFQMNTYNQKPILKSSWHAFLWDNFYAKLFFLFGNYVKIWFWSQHPPTQWNLWSIRWSSVDKVPEKRRKTNIFLYTHCFELKVVSLISCFLPPPPASVFSFLSCW